MKVGGQRKVRWQSGECQEISGDIKGALHIHFWSSFLPLQDFLRPLCAPSSAVLILFTLRWGWRGSSCHAHAGAGEEAAVQDVTGEGQAGAVHDMAAEIDDALLVHARACEETADHDGAEEDAEAVLVHLGADEEVVEVVLVHVRVGD